MKSLKDIYIGAGLFASLLLFYTPPSSAQSIAETSSDSVVQLAAESQGLERMEYAALPKAGTFWLVLAEGRVLAPLPRPPKDASLPVFQIAAGQFLVDGTGGQVNLNTKRAKLSVESVLENQAGAVMNLIERVQTAEFNRAFALEFGLEEEAESFEMNSLLRTALVGDTNGLWLEITNVSNGTVQALLHNATNTVYQILSRTNLAQTDWQTETDLWPETNVVETPFAAPTLGREILFLWARDWTDVDDNTNGIPDWWEWRHFGNFNQLATGDYDEDGIDNATEYANHTDPNTVSFTVRLGNQQFNTINATGSYLVVKGEPAYAAVLVNRVDFTNAVWHPYDGNIVFNLGSTNGVYTVWLALKGRASESTATWIGTDVTLNQQAPELVVTSSHNTVVVKPWLQVQGFSPKPLANVTYDLNGQTNQSGFITSSFLDTNLFAYTTNFFQCYDLLLDEGTNFITLHATDPAGNIVTTNFNVVLDYASATNPTVQLTWPQDKLELCGDSFTVRGWTEDAAAEVFARITDNNGNTNQVTGLVERTGKVWVENLPLNAGTNFVTLVVTNSAGLSSETNFTVVKSSMTLAVTSIEGSLWLPVVNVSGTISDPTASISVNGIQGTNNGDGTWSAAKVPVPEGGVASFDVNATPAGAEDPAISYNVVKESEVALQSALWNSCGFMQATNEGDRVTINGSFIRGVGGSIVNDYEAVDSNANFYQLTRQISTLSLDGSLITHIRSISSTATNDVDGGPNYTIAKELGVLHWRSTGSGAPQGWDKSSEVDLVLNIGGYAKAGSEVFVEAGVGEGTEQLAKPPYSQDIVVTDLLVDGLNENLDVTGKAIGKSTPGAKVKVNLKAPVPRHSFGNTATAPMPVSQVVTMAWSDTNFNRTKLGVGEEAILFFKPDLTRNAKWQTSAGGLLQTNYTSNFFTAPSNANPNVVVKATVQGKTISFHPFNVVEPSSETSVITSTDTFSAGVQGVGMHLKLIFHPTDVSFYRVQWREISGPATNITGCFTNYNPSVLAHSANPLWDTLTSYNTASDHSAFSGVSPPWSPGGYDTDIPIQWKIIGSSITNNNFPHELSQKRITDTHGTSTQTKLGSTTTRTP
jgi:hypothetical protein